MALVGLCRSIPAPEADKDYLDSVHHENLPAYQHPDPDAVLDDEFDLDTELDHESESLVVNNFFETGSVIVCALNSDSLEGKYFISLPRLGI